MPIIFDDDEKREWSDAVFKARHITELEQYFASYGGPLVTYGYDKTSGYLKAGVNMATPEKVNESMIDDIYQIIDEHYEQRGISDIPVVFTWEEGETTIDEAIIGDIPSPDEVNISVISDDGTVTTCTSDEAYLDDEGNLVIRENKKGLQTPGFTLPVLALGLLLLVRIKKK